MHELSIAQNIIEIVIDHAKNIQAKSVCEVELDIGTISGVIPETLEFALEVSIKDTILEKAKIIINVIEAKAICRKCEKHFDLDDVYTLCPHCGSFEFDIIQGKELKVKSIKIEDN